MTTRTAEPAARSRAGIPRQLVLLLAFACGAAVANLYYAQPLLHTLSVDFGVRGGTAGLLVTVTQLGYVLGLAFVVPLGDLLERRNLISGVLVLTALAQGVAALAPSLAVFAGALLAVGLTSVVAQVIVPMSSSLAGPHERGRVVGTVMSGLLIGILLARTFSGLVAAAAGWRTVFGLAALAMLLLAAALRRALPRVPPSDAMPYRALLGSVFALVREQPVLRQRMALGGLAFGCFSVLWTSLAFLLSGVGGGHYHYGNAAIGLFGLAGVAGAAVAPVAGRLSDRGHGRLAATGALVVLLASWGLLAWGESSLPALLAGIIALDLGVQGLHISNQSTIYALAPEARSRLTTAYMVAYFIGGTVLSGLTSGLYASSGWSGVCVLGAATALLALGVWALTERGSSGPGASRSGPGASRSVTPPRGHGR